ncbi:reverse transcriptase domain-containing protein [Tanacetum coccineum]
MVANQIRPPGTNFNQNRGSNLNQGQVYQPPPNQPPVYQAPTLQPQGVSKTNFENYVKANDAVLRNMQNQGQGTLPSQTVTNPREHVNAITTRSGKTCEGPSTPLVPTPDHDSIFIEIPKPRAKKTVQEPNSPDPYSYQPKLPYPERMKVREKDTPSAQQSKFMKLFKQLRLEIGLKDALIEMPKFNKWLSTLLRNKEKLEEIAITTINAECSAIILNKVPEKLEDPRKFLIPKLGLGALKPTRMTLELANRSVTHPMGIAEDVVVRVNGFTFLADFVVVNFEPDPRVPIILGRPFLRTAKALIDLYEEKLTLRVGNDELIDEDVENKNSNVSDSDEPVLLNTPLTDKVECSAPEADIDEIDAFLAMEVSSNFEEVYFDSEGDVIFLENLLSDDTTHNLAPEVISDHEPEQNNTSITFSPRSDPLHHEFAGELITLPSRIAREHEEYLSRMTLFCEISISRSQENVHANPSSIIESLPISLIPIEDSDPVQEEIDIFLVPDDLIPPGVENDDSEDEDNELLNLDHQDNPSSPHPPPKPPDVCFNIEHDTTMNDEDFNQGEVVLSINVEDVNSFTFVI